MKIWRVGIGCWIPTSTNANSEYVIVIAFPLQQWLHKRDSMLRYTYIAFLFLFALFRVSRGLATIQSIIHEDLPNNRKHDSELWKIGNTKPHLPVNFKMQKCRSTNIPRTLHVPRTCR